MNIEDVTIKIDAARASEIRQHHYCTMQATAALRWKVGPYYPMLRDDCKLEQANSCIHCGKIEWLEVPTVKEEA